MINKFIKNEKLSEPEGTFSEVVASLWQANGNTCVLQESIPDARRIGGF